MSSFITEDWLRKWHIEISPVEDKFPGHPVFGGNVVKARLCFPSNISGSPIITRDTPMIDIAAGCGKTEDEAIGLMITDLALKYQKATDRILILREKLREQNK